MPESSAAFTFFVQHLDWLALAASTVGGLVWAHNGAWAKYSGAWWLVASLLWVAFAWLNNLPALGIRDVIGIATAGWGCYRWMKPAERTAEPAAPLANPN